MKLRVKRHAVVQPLDQSYRLIPLTQGQNAIVDAEDFERLSKWNWFAIWTKNVSNFYAARSENPRVFMHKFLLGCGVGQKGDHVNHNTLDNRKQNLRKCTDLESSYNRRVHRDNISGFKGVGLSGNRWYARITVNKKTRSLGSFDKPRLAAMAYDAAAKKYHGKFAVLNFPHPTNPALNS